MTNQAMSPRFESAPRTRDPAPLSVEASLRPWCLAALNGAPGGVLSLDRLRDICRGTAAAEGEEDVEPIDLGRVALALAGDPNWEVVCRRARPRKRR
jgi:hypothetical protein